MSRDVLIVKVWALKYPALYPGIFLWSYVYEYSSRLSMPVQTYYELGLDLLVGDKPCSEVQYVWARGIFINKKD